MSISDIVTPSHRQALCRWGFQTIAACHCISHSTAIVAISYFDRFLGSSSSAANRALSDLRELQLAFVACLVIALKAHSGLNVECDFVSNVVCRNTYDSEEIMSMEVQVLQSLSWKLNGPTAHDFIDYFVDATPHLEGSHKRSIKHLSKALVEISFDEYDVAIQYPSEVAFTAISYSLDYAGLHSLNCLPFLKMIAGFDPVNDLQLTSRLGSLNQVMVVLVHELLTENDHGALDLDVQRQNYVDAFSSVNSPISTARELL